MIASVSILWRSHFLEYISPMKVSGSTRFLRHGSVPSQQAGCVQPWYVLLKRAQHLTFFGVDSSLGIFGPGCAPLFELVLSNPSTLLSLFDSDRFAKEVLHRSKCIGPFGYI